MERPTHVQSRGWSSQFKASLGGGGGGGGGEGGRAGGAADGTKPLSAADEMEEDG